MSLVEDSVTEHNGFNCIEFDQKEGVTQNLPLKHLDLLLDKAVVYCSKFRELFLKPVISIYFAFISNQ